MTKARPKLVTFGISHFCEKARWALDWHGITYDEISWPPGVHLVLTKRCGAKATTLPIVLDGERGIQGRGAIIDWAAERRQDRDVFEPLPSDTSQEVPFSCSVGFKFRHLQTALFNIL